MNENVAVAILTLVVIGLVFALCMSREPIKFQMPKKEDVPKENHFVFRSYAPHVLIQLVVLQYIYSCKFEEAYQLLSDQYELDSETEYELKDYLMLMNAKANPLVLGKLFSEYIYTRYPKLADQELVHKVFFGTDQHHRVISTINTRYLSLVEDQKKVREDHLRRTKNRTIRRSKK